MKDEEIIVMFRNRTQDAIRALDDKYGDQSRNLAGRLTGNRQDGEECTSDGELAVWNAVPPDEPRSLGAYFFCIVRRIACNLYRKRIAEKRGGKTAVMVELTECVEGDGDPASEVEKKELEAALNRFLDGLDYDARTMFLRRYWFGDTAGEIGALFGISEGAVRTKLHRIRAMLKTQLTKEGLL